MVRLKQWNNFKGELWKNEINVRDFILNNYNEYMGDESFLTESSDKTKKLWSKCQKLLEEEIKKGVIDIETNIISGIDNFEAGYIDKDNEVIVGLQTDKPLKRIVNLYGGVKMAESALQAYGYQLNPEIQKHFKEYRVSHNDGVFAAYTKEIRSARSSGLITGLPDAYGRGRIIGDYRRVALYGIDYLISQKQKDFENLSKETTEETIRLREELTYQQEALNDIKKMALKYGFDISKPASNAKEAIQWLYLGYLAAIKENNGAAMSLGRTATFVDIYIERDLKSNVITEEEAQELIDQFIIKLRLARQLRTPEYNELFAGDPTWVTEAIGGMSNSGKSLVTKSSFRYLHTLINLGSAPEPNLTILWSDKLPTNFKKYCAKISKKTAAIQYENDDIMRPVYGDDYAIACCVSAMTLGKQLQYFGARCNLAQALLYAINSGIDEVINNKVVDGITKINSEYLNYNEVINSFDLVLEKVAKLYVDAMNIIHYMHDKYAYESSQLALHDTNIERLMAFGASGLSVVADSLSAIKYAKVKPIRNEEGIAIDFEIIGDYPKYGNDDDRVDSIAVKVVESFSNKLKQHKLYRNAIHTLSILTITSNIVYGQKTGATPDGPKSRYSFCSGS